MPLVGIIGLPVVDQVAHLPTFPEPGGHVGGTGLTVTPGGPACNYATAITRLGGRALLVGVLGDDVFGQLITDALGHEGVDVSTLSKKQGRSTVTVLVLFDQEGQGEQRSFSFALGENLDLDMLDTELALQKLATVDALFLDGILAFSDTWTAAGVRAARHVKEQGASPLIICDPNLRVSGSTLPDDVAERVRELLQMSDVILVNERESFLLTGTKDPEEASYLLLDEYENAELVVVKLGAAGALLRQRSGATNSEPLFIAPFVVEVADTSGAGDAFGAAFILALLEGCTPEEAGRLAAASGALATTSKGAWLGLPTRSAQDRLVQEAGELP